MPKIWRTPRSQSSPKRNADRRTDGSLSRGPESAGDRVDREEQLVQQRVTVRGSDAAVPPLAQERDLFAVQHAQRRRPHFQAVADPGTTFVERAAVYALEHSPREREFMRNGIENRVADSGVVDERGILAHQRCVRR